MVQLSLECSIVVMKQSNTVHVETQQSAALLPAFFSSSTTTLLLESPFWLCVQYYGSETNSGDVFVQCLCLKAFLCLLQSCSDSFTTIGQFKKGGNRLLMCISSSTLSARNKLYMTASVNVCLFGPIARHVWLMIDFFMNMAFIITIYKIYDVLVIETPVILLASNSIDQNLKCLKSTNYNNNIEFKCKCKCFNWWTAAV